MSEVMFSIASMTAWSSLLMSFTISKVSNVSMFIVFLFLFSVPILLRSIRIPTPTLSPLYLFEI